MADIELTSVNIAALQPNGAIVRPYTAGSELTVGYAVYIGTDGYIDHTDANVSLAATRAIGVVVESFDGETTIASGNAASVCVFGSVSGYTGMTPGANIYVSDTVGRIADAAGTANRIIGYAERAGVLFVHPEQNDPSSS